MNENVERKEDDSIIEDERATPEATEANWNAVVVKVGVKEENEEEEEEEPRQHRH